MVPPSEPRRTGPTAPKLANPGSIAGENGGRASDPSRRAGKQFSAKNVRKRVLVQSRFMPRWRREPRRLRPCAASRPIRRASASGRPRRTDCRRHPFSAGTSPAPSEAIRSRSSVSAISLGATLWRAALAFSSTFRSSSVAVASAESWLPWFNGGRVSDRGQPCLHGFDDFLGARRTSEALAQGAQFGKLVRARRRLIGDVVERFVAQHAAARHVLPLASRSRHAASSISTASALRLFTRSFRRFHASSGWVS